jgi:uncharacterized protein
MSKIRLADVREKLSGYKNELNKYDVKKLMVFGSVARGDNNKDSDIDFLVEFKGRPTFDNLAGLHIFLQDLFKVKVDLVRKEIIRKELKEEVFREAKSAA